MGYENSGLVKFYQPVHYSKTLNMLVSSKMFILLFIHYFNIGFTEEQCEIYGSVPVHLHEVGMLNGLPLFQAHSLVEMYLYGNNFKENIHIGVTDGTNCEYVQKISTYSVESKSENHVVVISFIAPPVHVEFFQSVRYYFCLKDPNSQQKEWVHQGVDNSIGFFVFEELLTVWHYLILIVIFFSISSLMSGLNIGLMALDVDELILLKNAGSEKEKKYAKKILPVRRKGNYMLCSILITSTFCNAFATVIIDSFVADFVAALLTTCIIVLCCEILPQAICTSYPLPIGANTIWITKACMILTIPLSYPLGKILNIILKKELKSPYDKDRLKELVKMTTLKTHETRIISGVLDLVQKKVEDVMTHLDDMFKLPITAVMDFKTIASILQSGYSRIPIYVGSTSNIRYVLFTKDLAVLDPDDNIPVKVMVQNLRHGCPYIPVGTRLDEALGLFKEKRVHMGFVVGETLLDEDKNVIGLITFEDIIEEIFQEEIIDESDTWIEKRNKNKPLKTGTDSLFSFLEHSKKAVSLSANLKLSTYHFLTLIGIFSAETISPRALVSLLGTDVYCLAPGKKSLKDTIFVRGVPASYFVMVIEGLVEVNFDSEELKFEAGPFKYFGVAALQQNVFTPDYTIEAITKTIYLKIHKVQYQAAIAATRYERFNEQPNAKTDSEMYTYYLLLTNQKRKSSEANLKK